MKYVLKIHVVTEKLHKFYIFHSRGTYIFIHFFFGEVFSFNEVEVIFIKITASFHILSKIRWINSRNFSSYLIVLGFGIGELRELRSNFLDNRNWKLRWLSDTTMWQLAKPDFLPYFFFGLIIHIYKLRLYVFQAEMWKWFLLIVFRTYG